MKDLMSYMDSLTNYEKLGVPKDAGTDSEDGFDLVRMRRLMEHLDNPHSKFKVRTFAENNSCSLILVNINFIYNNECDS